MKTKNFFLTLLLTAVIFVPFSTNAQITIGSESSPSPWSLLDLCTREQKKALHNALMDTDQRNKLMNDTDWSKDQQREAQGLLIFNIDPPGCLEFWNGRQWVSLCDDRLHPPVILPPPYNNDSCWEEDDCTGLAYFPPRHVRQLNDGTPQNFSAAGIPSFNMMPVTGGVFYRGNQSESEDKIPNYDPIAESAGAAEPVHRVAVHSFFMGQTAVTNELFTAVMRFEGATIHGNLNSIIKLFENYYQWDSGPNRPRHHMTTWYDAIVFSNRLSAILGRQLVYRGLNYDNLLNPTTAPGCSSDPVWSDIRQNRSHDGFRLPTEAEWEYAARGGQQNEYTRTMGVSGTQYLFSGSNNVSLVACLGFGGDLSPVRSFAPNELGIYDMSGSVNEWNWDWLADYDACCLTDPEDTGFNTGVRVTRGGSFRQDAVHARIAHRDGWFPAVRELDIAIGFRVVFSVR